MIPLAVGAAGCAGVQSSHTNTITVKHALAEVQQVADTVINRGVESKDPGLVRAGAELGLAAGNVLRVLGSEMDSEVSSLDDNRRKMLSHLEASARVVRRLRAGSWFLEDVSLIDLRDSADLVGVSPGLTIREIRGVAVFDPTADPTLVISGHGITPELLSKHSLQITVAGRVLETSRVSWPNPNQMQLTLPKDVLSIDAEKPTFVPVTIDFQWETTKGEWPFRYTETSKGSSKFYVTVVPAAAGTLMADIQIAHTQWVRVGPADPQVVFTGDTKGRRKPFGAQIVVPSSGQDPPKLGDRRIVEGRWRCVKQVLASCGMGEPTVTYSNRRTQVDGNLIAWGKNATWQLEADVEELRETETNENKGATLAVQWGRSSQIVLPTGARKVTLRGVLANGEMVELTPNPSAKSGPVTAVIETTAEGAQKLVVQLETPR